MKKGGSGIVGLIVSILVMYFIVSDPFQSSNRSYKTNTSGISNNYSYNTSSNKHYTNTARKNNTYYEDSNSDNSEIVYITNTGSKYHRAGCQYLKRSSYAIEKDDAISIGYEACSRCRP